MKTGHNSSPTTPNKLRKAAVMTTLALGLLSVAACGPGDFNDEMNPTSIQDTRVALDKFSPGLGNPKGEDGKTAPIGETMVRASDELRVGYSKEIQRMYEQAKQLGAMYTEGPNYDPTSTVVVTANPDAEGYTPLVSFTQREIPGQDKTLLKMYIGTGAIPGDPNDTPVVDGANPYAVIKLITRHEKGKEDVVESLDLLRPLAAKPGEVSRTEFKQTDSGINSVLEVTGLVSGPRDMHATALNHDGGIPRGPYGAMVDPSVELMLDGIQAFGAELANANAVLSGSRFADRSS